MHRQREKCLTCRFNASPQTFTCGKAPILRIHNLLRIMGNRVGTTPRIKEEKTMKPATMMKGAILACCLIGMLVLPAAAAPAGQAGTGQVSAIDQGLKNDLRASHHQYRLQELDLHVQRANSVIGILDKYDIDTSRMQATLAAITDKRAALDTALTNKDQAALKTLNADLTALWKQFIQETKDAVKAHYPAARAAAKSSGTGSAGTTSGPSGAALVV
jgi:hypothetical protein